MKAITYHNFDLLIEAISETEYQARVLDSPAGQAGIKFVLPISDLEELLSMGKDSQNSISTSVLRYDEQTAKSIGDKLFTLVFSGQINSVFNSSLQIVRPKEQGLRIRLRLSTVPKLNALPWEFLYDSTNSRFLANSIFTPIVRFLDLPEATTPLIVPCPLNILVMIAELSSGNQLDTEKEWLKIKTALSPLEEKLLVKVDRMEVPTLGNLQSQLRKDKYHVFHFIGHGSFDPKAQNGGLLVKGIESEDQFVSGFRLGTLLRDHFSLRLVLLNVCNGAVAKHSEIFSGVAQYLVQQGIPAVIAMQFNITDQAAITVASEFYEALAHNFPVDTALTEARKAVYTNGNDTEWATPVLYLKGNDAMLFDISEQVNRTSSANPVVRAKTIRKKGNALSRKTQTKHNSLNYLVCLNGADTGLEYIIDNDSITIGRSENSDIVLGDEYASRHHAILLIENDNYLLCDLHSKNGTYVDGVRLPSGGKKWIGDGCDIQFASTKFRFSSPTKELEGISIPDNETIPLNLDLYIDTNKKEVYVFNKPIKPQLNDLEFGVIAYLFEKRGSIVDEGELIQHCWQKLKTEPDIDIKLVIERIRKRIEPYNTEHYDFIKEPSDSLYRLSVIQNL